MELKREAGRPLQPNYWRVVLIAYVALGMLGAFASGYAFSRGGVIEKEILECHDR